MIHSLYPALQLVLGVLILVDCTSPTCTTAGPGGCDVYNSHQPTKPNALEQIGAVQRQGQAWAA